MDSLFLFDFSNSDPTCMVLICKHLVLQTCQETKDLSALTKAADFVKAFILGFQVEVSLPTARS